MPTYQPAPLSGDTSMDRRDFLKQSAAAGSAPFLLGGPPAFIKSLRPGPNERVRFACIGVGGKGTSDTRDAGKHGDVLGLCDVNDNTLNARATELAGKHKNIKKYYDYRKMLEELG